MYLFILLNQPQGLYIAMFWMFRYIVPSAGDWDRELLFKECITKIAKLEPLFTFIMPRSFYKQNNCFLGNTVLILSKDSVIL